MNLIKYYVPTFRYTQVNKKLDGTEKSPTEVFIDNISEIIKIISNDHDNCVVIGIKQKLSDKEYAYSIIGFPNKTDNDLIHIKSNLPDNHAPILIEKRETFLHIFERIWDKFLSLV